jgi:hypothetical protein
LDLDFEPVSLESKDGIGGWSVSEEPGRTVGMSSRSQLFLLRFPDVRRAEWRVVVAQSPNSCGGWIIRYVRFLLSTSIFVLAGNYRQESFRVDTAMNDGIIRCSWSVVSKSKTAPSGLEEQGRDVRPPALTECKYFD